MENLFLAHPVAFVLVAVVLATLVHELSAKALRAATYAVESRLYRNAELARAAAYAVESRLYRNAELARARKAVDVLSGKEDNVELYAWERAEARQDIATRLLAAWTPPHRDVNGDMHHEVIDAVLVAKAYGEADIILAARAKTPLEIVTGDAPTVMTFAEMVADAEEQAARNGTHKEREHTS